MYKAKFKHNLKNVAVGGCRANVVSVYSELVVLYKKKAKKKVSNNLGQVGK